jgi:uncharacterized protein (TIGR02147 family)
MLLQSGSCRRFLSEELARRSRANPRYSQRAFARQLGLAPGELSEVLSGRRPLSVKSAMKIACALGLSPAETRHLVYLSQLERVGAAEPTEEPQDALRTQQLTLDMFHIVSDWYCFAILNLADTDDFRSETQWIARRLGISPAEAKVALERLERVGLLERDPATQGRTLRVARDYVLSPSGVPSEAVRSYHRQILKKASEALELQTVEEREISGVGLAVHPKHIDAIKKEMSEFQDRIVAKYGKGLRKEVYHLEMALFRLTEKGEKR